MSAVPKQTASFANKWIVQRLTDTDK